MGKDAEDDEKDDEARNPGEALVYVDDAVAEGADDERGHGDDEDASPARHIVVDRMEELGADDDVDGRPAQAGQDVEDSDCAVLVKFCDTAH